MNKTIRTRRPLTQQIDQEALARIGAQVTGEVVLTRAERIALREQRKADKKTEMIRRAAHHYLWQIGAQAHFDACQNPLPLFSDLMGKTLKNIERAERESLAAAKQALTNAGMIQETVTLTAQDFQRYFTKPGADQ